MHDYEGRRLESTSGRWRAFAWALTALGFLGIAVLSCNSARAGALDAVAVLTGQAPGMALLPGRPETPNAS
jgi:hypothetical protein